MSFTKMTYIFGGLDVTSGHSLHGASVLTAYLVKRMGDLSEAGHADGFHQFGEDVATGTSELFQTLKCRRRFLLMSRLKTAQVIDLLSLLLRRGTGEFYPFDLFRSQRLRRFFCQKRIDTDNR